MRGRGGDDRRSPTLAAGRGGGGHGGGGGGMHGGSFHGQGGFHHDGFHNHGFHHGHAAFVVGVGWPGWWGYPYYGWPYPYSYPAYYDYAPPTQYIEQGDGSDAPSANAWWYRCDQPSGYYPYVKNCPGGWHTVPAQPSP
ncbi:hypothetical protein AWV80_22365 [Cupriavidus sp. UYMU48A]|nr:hypothetical protein AWV80_22365 [Cupriavidus sp. UYMU48A]